MITRRMMLAGAATIAAAGRAPAQDSEPPTDADGLYTQPWFHTSFLDMAEDLGEARQAGKHLMILWEQRGCPYCRELHRVNLVRPEIRDYLLDTYLVVQLNLWGDRAVTDFDGQVLAEKRMARKWGVTFTPTVILINSAIAAPASMAEAEAFRMPGYFKPFHFLSGAEFAAGGNYRDEHFQRFLQARANRLRERGIEPDLW
ncbi:MAG: thioredoxin family protein [Jhaorihella sp.]